MKYAVTGSSYKHSVGYKYDISNNLLSLVEDINDTALTTSYTYDKDNRVTSVTTVIDTGADPTTVTETYTYDEWGRVYQKVTKNGANTVLTETYTYVIPSSGKYSTQVEKIEGRNAAGTVIYSYAYTYDNNGNITRIADGVNNTVYATYTYDSANQLTRADDLLAFKTWEWTYDDAGNITDRTEYSYHTGSLENAAGTTVSYLYEESPLTGEAAKNDPNIWGDLLLSYNGQSFSYDSIGNLTGDGTWSYAWEKGRQLASMTGNGTTWSFTYDADGMRTARTDGTTAYGYTYNGGQLTQMTVGADTLTFTYDASGNPQTVTYGGTTYYYATNLQGDVIAILNSAGTKVVSYTYDAWGNSINIAHSMASTLGTLNPLRYRGYVYDHETGLYYLQSRYYNPKLGRFINADALVSTGQGLLGNNMFAYCLNNPVCNKDTAGLFTQKAFDNDGDPTSDDDDDGGTASTGASSVYTAALTVCVSVNADDNEIDEIRRQLKEAAKKVNVSIEGHGAVVGTKKHKALKDEVEKLGNKRLRAEVSYKDSSEVSYGTKGSARFDVIYYAVGDDGNMRPLMAWDLKTGVSGLSPTRIAEMLLKAGIEIIIELLR